MTRMRHALIAFAVAALVGCGGDRSDEVRSPATAAARSATVTATPEPARATRAPRRGRTVRTAESQFGRIVTDAKRQAVYIFDREKRGRSECYGACAQAWPPVLTRGRPVAGRGVRQRLLGTTRRRDGTRHVTYRGRPVYYYVHDAPGRVLCHDVREFGGVWLVIRPDGTRVP